MWAFYSSDSQFFSSKELFYVSCQVLDWLSPDLYGLNHIDWAHKCIIFNNPSVCSKDEGHRSVLINSSISANDWQILERIWLYFKPEIEKFENLK